MAAGLGILNGILFSIMNYFNAQLSQVYGNFAATFMIHLVGLITLLPVAFTWGRPKGQAPLWCYTGGFIGIVTVMFCNIGISGIGVTANLVLALLGQIITGAVIDHNGWFGIPKVKINKKKAAGMLLIALGAGVMLIW